MVFGQIRDQGCEARMSGIHIHLRASVMVVWPGEVAGRDNRLHFLLSTKKSRFFVKDTSFFHSDDIS